MNKNKSSIKKNESPNEVNNEKQDIINNIKFLLVEKSGNIKEVIFNNFDINELYKKCGFRKSENFVSRHIWSNIKIKKNIYNIEIWSRNDGKANTENKYDFPPPIDKDLYFGNCAILQIDIKTKKYKNLTKDIWDKVYEKLFGNFENLNDTYDIDDNEEDELKDIKKDLKTKKSEYLKDGFVVDSDDEENESGSCDDDDETSDETDISTEETNEEDVELEDENIDYEINIKSKKAKNNIKKKQILQIAVTNSQLSLPLNNYVDNDELFLEDITNGSELTFEEYEYD